MPVGMAVELDRALQVLEAVAPTRLAQEWDNVGLLLDPRAAGDATAEVSRVLLTIDLTERVLAEALELGAELVVSYHPPIFRGLKRLSGRRPLDRVVATAIRRGVAVYSPHTALDAAKGGVNDWLAEAVGPGSISALHGEPTQADLRGQRVELVGLGRRVELAEPARLEVVVQRIKAHLGLERVRVAASELHRGGKPITDAAVCAGAGGEVFESAPWIHLFITGEMRHHDVLAKVASGSSVVLCDHTNTERGYLPRLAERLRSELSVDVVVSRLDRDPLEVV